MSEPTCPPQTRPRVDNGQVFPAPQPGSGPVAGPTLPRGRSVRREWTARGVPCVGPLRVSSQSTIPLTGHGVLWGPSQP